jgi:hypothetical protein
MREAENNVKIEGIISEINLENGSYVKDGKTIETVRGRVNVLVNQVINGVPVESEIPIEMFSPKYTKAGALNPSYESIMRIKDEMVSIAAAGGQEGADGIRIKGRLMMNEYFNQAKQFVSFPRITTSFATKVDKKNLKPEASFDVEMVVASQGYVDNPDGTPMEDANGNPRYEVTGLIPMYGGKIDKVKFVCANENVINSVKEYWQDGDTVKAHGRLNFSSTTETSVIEEGFGEAVERSRTITVRDLVITGGNPTPLDGEFAFSASEIKSALAERQARLEELKRKSEEKPMRTRMAPAPANTVSKGSFDLGF